MACEESQSSAALAQPEPILDALHVLSSLRCINIPKVWLTEWKPGLKKVSLTKLLQEQANLSLKTAKGCVDCLLAGEKVALEMATRAAAKALAAEASKLGVAADLDRM